MPLLSILIPTKSNAPTIGSTVATARAVKISDAEIIVQDCGETDEGERQVRNIADSRLRYYRSPVAISMTANWNAGLDNCHGDYVCIVGADDGISPRLGDVVTWAIRDHVSAVVAPFTASYAWPRPDGRGGDTGGVLTIGNSYTGAISYVSASEALHAYCRTGADYAASLKLPSLYRCLVSRTLLNDLRKRISHYLAGTSPDVYSSVVLAKVAATWAHVDYPLFLPGYTAESNTVRIARRKFDTDLKRHYHTKEYGNLTWPTSVPEFACNETTVAESTLLALSDLGCHELLRGFDYGALYGRCLVGHPQCWRATWKSLRSHVLGAGAGPAALAATVVIGLGAAEYCRRRFTSAVQKRLQTTRPAWVFRQVQTVEQAVETLNAAIPELTLPQ